MESVGNSPQGHRTLTPESPILPADPPKAVPGTPRWIPIVLAVSLVLIGALAYGHYTKRQQLLKNASDTQQQNQALVGELDKTNSRVADLRGQLQVTLDKLGMTQQDLAHARQLAQEIREQQKTSDESLRSQIGQVQQETTDKIGVVSSALTHTQSDVAATKTDLETPRRICNTQWTIWFDCPQPRRGGGVEATGGTQYLRVQSAKTKTSPARGADSSGGEKTRSEAPPIHH
jgi:Tfp pilus assembly major pilin PilA